MGALCITVVWFWKALNFSFDAISEYDSSNEITVEAILSLLTVLVPSISSLLVAFIKIPQVIAEYLFNKEEDNYMNSIIKNLQNYDKAMFKMKNELGKTLDKNKEKTGISSDGIIDGVPAQNV